MNIKTNSFIVIDIAFLFDLDGVIIDSESEYSKIWKQINQEFPTGTNRLEEIIKGCTLTKILDEYYPEPSVREKVCNRLHFLENKMRYEYKVGSLSFLSLLKEMQIPKALVTSSDQTKMTHLEEEIPGITHHFDFIVTAELVSSSKPSPEGYLLAAEKLGTTPQKCAVVEDSLQGVMAGYNSGAFVIGVEGTLSADTLRPYSNIIVKNLMDLDLTSVIGLLNKNE